MLGPDGVDSRLHGRLRDAGVPNAGCPAGSGCGEPVMMIAVNAGYPIQALRELPWRRIADKAQVLRRMPRRRSSVRKLARELGWRPGEEIRATVRRRRTGRAMNPLRRAARGDTQRVCRRNSRCFPRRGRTVHRTRNNTSVSLLSMSSKAFAGGARRARRRADLGFPRAIPPTRSSATMRSRALPSLERRPSGWFATVSLIGGGFRASWHHRTRLGNATSASCESQFVTLVDLDILAVPIERPRRARRFQLEG